MDGEQGFTYFGSQASWGVTKHMGGLKATDELAGLCHIGSSTHVLEVGSGVGVSACHLARRYDCQVTGVDLSDQMVEWATKRAERRGLSGQVQFRTADALNLPFPDGQFDVVICESVTAFPQDKQKAVSEYARVVKPGGYVGLNEGTWISSPPEELVSYVQRTMANAIFLSPDGWRALLDNASLLDVVARPHAMNALSQRREETAGLDAQDWLDRFKAMGTFMGMYLRSPGFRRYAKQITPSMGIIRAQFRHMGYGLYVGRRASTEGH
jgi:ubiquinone/menaquinone biosynthesis C-methylase UbiE